MGDHLHSDAAVSSSANVPQQACPVVGIGASAGGLEAFRQLLAHLPEDTGMVFVLIQHLDPIHESQLAQVLAKSTRLPITEVSDGMAIAPNHIYVIPPNVNMTIAQGAAGAGGGGGGAATDAPRRGYRSASAG